MGNLDAVELSEMPHMADFAQWVEAAARALGWQPGAFAAAYRDNLGVGHRIALESSSFGQALERFMTMRETWEGSASDLLDKLIDLAHPHPQQFKYWPQSPTLVTKQLKELAPNLRASGIETETGIRAAGGKKRLIRLDNREYNDLDAKRAKDDSQPKTTSRLDQTMPVARNL